MEFQNIIYQRLSSKSTSPAPASPSSPLQPIVPEHSSTSADAASVETSDTSNVVAAESAAFAQLRHQQTVEYLPDLKSAGNWRSFGRVRCSITFLPNGTFSKLAGDSKKARRKSWEERPVEIEAREKLVMTGTVWLRKSELLFTRDSTLPEVVEKQIPIKPKRRISLNIFGSGNKESSDGKKVTGDTVPSIEVDGTTITAIKVSIEHIRNFRKPASTSNSLVRTLSGSSKDSKTFQPPVLEIDAAIPLHVRATRKQKECEHEGRIELEFLDQLTSDESEECYLRLSEMIGRKA